ncbi:amino-acid N-acetyltransferase [Opitutales bacterium ASA1]|uniref:amino-acid N-acetyltransferase n=1 Tax=Congregicoccus parvus TaxID=3081749 RepID=UPI002B2A3F9E|nr:amino-acid N-acetyltransferase [Opitutales bacterium ASA1]
MNAPGQTVTPIKPTDLRGILAYVPRFQGQIFIVALDGVVVADENLSNLLLDIAVLRSLQIKVVLVHGIGHQLKELSVIRQVPISDLAGSGVTDAATLDLAIRASSRVSHQILEGLTQSGLKCAITNSIRAVPLGVLKGVDHQFTGKVDRIDTDFIMHLINAGAIPIIQPIGFDRDGRSLRINSDLLATELATELHATKVVFLAPHAGIEVRGELRRQLSVDELGTQLAGLGDAIDSRVRSKAQHAVQAIRSGVPRVHLVDGRVHDALLTEIFSNDGVGTLVYGNDYQQIRRATKRDARRIYDLTRNAVKREELIHRTLQAVERNVENFYLFEIDENLIACVSLSFYPDKPGVAEIGSLYVLPFYHRRGIGKKMIEFACQEAKKRGASQVLALSTQSFTFFSAVCGFTETTKDALPDARRQVFEQSQRNPRILTKAL